MMAPLSRRTVLRGAFHGAAVGVALPVLDAFLDESGTAWAAGGPLPVRFGTWFWGLGCTPDRWKPAKVGPGYDITPELKPIEPFKDSISILSDFNIPLDGRSNMAHSTGWVALRSGEVPLSPNLTSPSFDVLISDQIGAKTRFRSLEVSGIAIKGANNMLSGRGPGSLNPFESSPLAFYQRLFGPGFADPNAVGFTPDPLVMARHSALSAVAEQRKALERRLGASDRQRLDQYFTALRQTEQQLALQLQKPAPLEACIIPAKPEKDTAPTTGMIADVVENHKVQAQLLAMALACNQTRVFNLAFNDATSTLAKPGSSTTHHQLTHEEPIDPTLSYQPEATFFLERCMEGFGYFVSTLAQFKEGDGTLLDNVLVLAHSETHYAKGHGVDGIPMMLVGRAGGKVKSGLHIDGKGTPASRVGLTLQQVMGVPVDAWGAGSLRTDKTLTELLV